MTKFQDTNNNQSSMTNWLLIFGYWLLFGVCCLVIGDSFASDSVQAIQSKYRSIESLTADFTQSTYVAVLDTTIKEPGVFSMKKPGKLRIEYKGDHPKTYISDGKKLWIVDAELNEVETYKVSKNSVPKEALEFLNGFGEMEKLFTVENKGSTLSLIPKTGNKQYNSLDCEFGPDNLLRKMTIHNKSGNISTYVFNDIRVNVKLDDDLFKP